MTLRIIALLSIALISGTAQADKYPDMTGKWTGDVRIVQTGTGQVARGGMEISEVKLSLTISHQDEESFIGFSRTSATPPDVRSTDVWGTIRSNGKEALFITSTGARGQLWFHDAEHFEFCVTNAEGEQVSAYCAELEKQKKEE